MTSSEAPHVLLTRAADRLARLAETTTKNICPEWTRLAVRHVARNVDIDCGHGVDIEESGRTYTDQDPGDGFDHSGWCRYATDAPWIATLSPAVAPHLVAWLRYTAKRVEVISRVFTAAAYAKALETQYAPPIAFARVVLGMETEREDT